MWQEFIQKEIQLQERLAYVVAHRTGAIHSMTVDQLAAEQTLGQDHQRERHALETKQLEENHKEVRETARSQNLLYGPNLVEITISFKLCEVDLVEVPGVLRAG